MYSVKDVIIALLVGGAVGIAIYKFLDPPPPPEVVEAISSSDWARAWASRFCGGTGEERQKCIEELTKKVAYSIAKGIPSY